MRYYFAIVSQLYSDYQLFFCSTSKKTEYLDSIELMLSDLIQYKRKASSKKEIQNISLRCKYSKGLQDESVHDASGQINIVVAPTVNELVQKCAVYYYRALTWKGNPAVYNADKKILEQIMQRHDRDKMSKTIERYFTLL